MKEIFIKNLLALSVSKDLETAKNEWIYIGQHKLLEPIQSPSFDNINNKICNSVIFYNCKTDKIFHAGTGSQYLIKDKGVMQSKIIKQSPEGNGTSFEVNYRLVKCAITNIKSLILKDVTPSVFKEFRKYNTVFTSINTGEPDEVEILKQTELFLNKFELIVCKVCKNEIIFRTTHFEHQYCEPCWRDLQY